MIVLDANILLRMADRRDPKYQTTLRAVFTLRGRDKLVIVPQTIFEFAAVATRARMFNGLEMDAPRVSRWISRYQAFFDTLPDRAELVDRWASLIATHAVTGFQVHDARYVAAMQTHGLSLFMTYNTKHFKKYSITLIDPDSI